MSCPYYWYNYHYACRKSEKDVNEDIYYKYCRNYDYSDCPIYKGQDSSGCFLTSACTEARGLPDDCHELMVLRGFRDGYLRTQPMGQEEIAEYYFVAPQVVTSIKQQPDAIEILNALYDKLVIPCVDLIERGENEAAHERYRSILQELKARYLCKND